MPAFILAESFVSRKMSARHPLDIPELAAAIRLHLTRKDLTVCLLVCRQWHAALLPLVWNTVDKTPTVEALQRHAHLVQTITCQNEFSPALSRITLPNLTALNIVRRSRRYDIRHQPWPMLSFTLFLQNNPTIVSLSFFDDDDFSPHTSQFWRAVADLPHPLRLLKVRCTFTHVESFVDFLTACSHTEILDLKYYTCSSWAFDIEDTGRIGSLRFQWLKTLHLRGLSLDAMEYLSAVLSHCPALERLSLGYLTQSPAIQYVDRLVFLARTRPWPLLKHLWVSVPQMTQEQLQDLLEAFTSSPLESLEMRCSITPQVFGSLVHTQFPTITHLSVMGRWQTTTSEMNQRILKLCPLLITFKGGRISNADIIDGPFAGPWACLRMEQLYLAFDKTVGDSSAMALTATRANRKCSSSKRTNRVSTAPIAST